MVPMALNAAQENRLLGSSLFSGCEPKSYKRMVQSLSPISILKGQVFTSFPYRNPSLGFMLEGSLDVCNSNGVLLSTLETGDFFELESLFSNIKPLLPMHMRARTNTIVTCLDKCLLLQILNADKTVAFNYMEILADGLQHLTCRIGHFTATSSSVGLSLYLLRHSNQNVFRLTDGLAGLARRLNISRATLYRALAELEQKRLVYHREKIIEILDRERLYQYVCVNSIPPTSSPSRSLSDHI